MPQHRLRLKVGTVVMLIRNLSTKKGLCNGTKLVISTMQSNVIETSPDRNVTTSVLTFVPTVEDGGKYLSCRGQQPQIPDNVPLVSLELGSNLNSSVIKEGVDVYFECNIKSNPWVYKVSWRHNGKQLYNNVQANTIVSNQSLVLQSITRARSGLYTCVGHNQEGDGESNPVQLDVKCKFHFVWKFNNTSESYDIPQSQIQTEKARSYAYYKPITEMDYGTLLCWGRNEIGMQKDPCVFYINPADSLSLECSEGFDGGLQQQFVMEVFDAASGRLVGNVTSRQPAFGVGGLDAGAGFKVNVYAANRKGRSPVVQLLAATLKSAEKHTAVPPVSEKPPPPENCTVLHQTRYYLSVGCHVADAHRAYSNTYLLQAFDAGSRLLLATATSRSPEEITVTDLPADYKDLLLFVRTMDGRSVASDANTIYVPAMAELKTGASTPVLLQITPLLGALIGVVAALILVAIIIVVVIRLRGGGDRGDKDYDDTELANNSRSTDSLEEKNPDIIPQNNAEDEYQDEERAFERLNNITIRSYSRIQSPNNQLKNENYITKHQQPLSAAPAQMLYSQSQQTATAPAQCIPMSLMRRPEPTVYAQLDVARMRPPLAPAAAAFHALQRHLPMTYQTTPRPVRDDVHATMTQQPHDGSVTSETPLLNQRDSSVSMTINC
nr:unnamed protein product [Callosobruchus analis]